MNIMCISARREAECNNLLDKYVTFMEKNDTYSLENILYTLQVGRKSYEYRWAATYDTAEEYVAALKGENLKCVKIGKNVKAKNNIIFAFAGQGSQYVGMGKELYEQNEIYKKHFDECADLLLNILKKDIRTIIFNSNNEEQLKQTEIAQPTIFSVEYALAKTLMDMGIKPKALIGHSLGEYTVACIAGVFELQDALRIVCKRGEMMQSCEKGSMLSVKLTEEEIRSKLLEGVEIAAINTSNLIVVAGKEEAISKQQALLEQEGVECRKLATSHGFHTAMIEPALEKLQYEIENTQTNMPQISYVSNLTGTWIDNKVQDVKYWLDHARNTVRFAQSSKFLLEKFADAIILEVGPGRTMTSLMRKSEAWSQKHKAVLFLDNKGNENELKQFYSGLMELWVSGVNINWNNYYKDKKMKRVPLPTYCFKKEVHILETKYQQETENISPVEVAKGQEVTCKEVTDSRENISTVYVEAEGEIEIRLVEFLERLLGVQPIGRYDNFFELGGNSMLATQVISWINNEYPINITMQDFFETSTVAELGEVINNLIMEVIGNLSLEELMNIVK